MARIGFSSAPGVKKHSELTDVSTPHVLADLEDAVCSETEADAKIAAQAATAVLATKTSDVLRNSNDAEVDYLNAAPYVKLKECRLNADLPFARVAFDMHGDPSFTGYARLYKNGAAIGTERSDTSNTYKTFSQDFDSWVKDDLIQIWGYTIVGASSHVRNFRFYYDPDDKITHIVGVKLVTELPCEERDPTISITNQDP